MPSDLLKNRRPTLRLISATNAKTTRRDCGKQRTRSGIKFHDGSPLTSEDVKANYDRIINPPEGVVSIRKAYYSDLVVDAPDPTTVIFKLKNPMAGVLEALASPYNCIYSAAKLKQNPRYPETEVMGSGPFTFVEHVKGPVGPASVS